MDQFCEKHSNVKMEIGGCSTCGGRGSTQFDLDEMDNPIGWHTNGNCWQCKGTGQGFLECPVCEEDAAMEEEMSYDEESK